MVIGHVMLSIDTDGTGIPTHPPGENNEHDVVIGKRCWAFPVGQMDAQYIHLC